MGKYVVINSNSLKFFDKLIQSERIDQTSYGSSTSSQVLSDMIVMPLDATSLTYVLQRKLPHVVPADILDSQRILHLPQRIFEKITAWAESINYHQLGLSCNWLLHDSVLLQTLLHSACTAVELIPFFEKNAHELILLRRLKPEFLPNLCCNDTPQLVWEKHLPKVAKVLPYQHQYAKFPPSDAWGQDFSSLQDSIAFAYYEVSIDRSYHHISQAIEKSNEKSTICIMPCMYNLSISRQIVSNSGIRPCPPYLVAPLESTTAATVDYFPDTMVDELVHSAENFFPELGIMAPIMRQFVNERYLYLERMYKGLRKLWSEHRPKVCVAENLAQGEYSIPLLVANELGIPSVSTPHSLLHFPTIATPPASIHACASPLVKQAYEERHSNSSAQTFAEVYCRTSYPASHDYTLKKKKKFSILVLPCDPIQRYVPLVHTSSPQIVSKWFKTLQTIPERLKGSVELFYKLHPGFGAEELFHAMGIDSQSIVPPAISAEAVIELFDLVVCIEYISSPNQMALEKGIPLVNCVYDASIFNPAQQQFLANTFTVGEFEAFWPLIMKNILNPLEKSNLINKQKDVLDSLLLAPSGLWVPTLEALGASPQNTPLKSPA